MIQFDYSSRPAKGIAGGIYDAYHYPIDSRFNEEENGVLRSGVGVVPGTVPGSSIKLPTEESTAADFEGVIVNGRTNQHDLEGRVYIHNNANVSVMRRGRVWVRVKDDAEPKYNDPLHLIVKDEVEGESFVGCFSNEGGIEVPGRFIGGVDNGLAPVELYGVTASAGGSSPDLSQYQKKITATGILKGDGNGGITAAESGTDYSTVKKLADLEDVEGTDSPNDKQVLKYQTDKWKPGDDEKNAG